MLRVLLKLTVSIESDYSGLTFYYGMIFDSFLCSISYSSKSDLEKEVPDSLPCATEWLYRFIYRVKGFEPVLRLRSDVMNRHSICFFHCRSFGGVRKVLVIASDDSDGGGIFTIPWENFEAIDDQIGEFG